MPWHTTLKKLAKNPVGAIKNSKFFKRIDTSRVLKSENLFFLVHLGQLGQVHGFINFESLENNQLCILYTAANKKMPRLVNNNADSLLFFNIFKQKIPLRPNRIKIRNFLYMERAYRDIIQKAKPKRIFIQSFEIHYALIASIAKEFNVELHLIEEGTATYKFNRDGDNTSPILDADEASIRRTAINRLPIFKKIRPALTAAREFTGVHVAFPNLLDQAFNADYFTRFFLYAPGNGRSSTSTEKTIKKYNITSEDFIYLSQKYLIDEFLFPREVIGALAQIAENNGARVIMKLHPKESERTLEVFKQIIHEKRLQNTIIPIEENDFLIEPCIALVKPKAIIGLTSTALAYSALISRDSKIVSIAPYILNNLDRLNTSTIEKDRFLKSNPGIKDIKKHLTLILRFDHVRFIHEKKELDSPIVTLGHTKVNADERTYTQQEKLSHICQLIAFDRVDSANILFDHLDQGTTNSTVPREATKLIRQKLASYAGNEKQSEPIHLKNSLISLFIEQCRSGDFDAARVALAEIKERLTQEDITILNLDADLALALLDQGSSEAAQKLVGNNNQAIIEGDKTWLYIAARVYSAQHKHWKAHCHFTWSLPDDINNIGLKPLHELLENANRLTNHENLDDLLILATKLYAASNLTQIDVKNTLELSIINCAKNNHNESDIANFKRIYLQISAYCSKKDIDYSPLKAILARNLIIEQKYARAMTAFQNMHKKNLDKDFIHLNIYLFYKLFSNDLTCKNLKLNKINSFINELAVPFEREILSKIFSSKRGGFYSMACSVDRDKIQEYLKSSECNSYVSAIIINFMACANHIGNVVDIFINLKKEIANTYIVRVERDNLY